jgi:uncharacterized protein
METIKNVLITGGTGLVGKALITHLQSKGYAVGVLSRSKPKEPDGLLNYWQWNPAEGKLDVAALQWAHAVIHLAGAGVADKPWSAARKKEIIDSRVDSMGLITSLLQEKAIALPVLISASAIGIYGNYAGSQALDEASPYGSDFLAEVCIRWEQALFNATLPHTRKAALRVGIVLAKEGGALPQIALPVRFGVGAALGDGKQMMSWIHIDDLCAMFSHLLEHPAEGAWNGTAPEPVSNKELTKTLAQVLRKPLLLPNVPAFVMKLALRERADLVLGGANVLPKKFEAAHFSFKFSNIKAALENIYKK